MATSTYRVPVRTSKLQEKNLLTITPHGNIRKIDLKENILNLLRGEKRIHYFFLRRSRMSHAIIAKANKPTMV